MLNITVCSVFLLLFVHLFIIMQALLIIDMQKDFMPNGPLVCSNTTYSLFYVYVYIYNNFIHHKILSMKIYINFDAYILHD